MAEAANTLLRLPLLADFAGLFITLSLLWDRVDAARPPGNR